MRGRCSVPMPGPLSRPSTTAPPAAPGPLATSTRPPSGVYFTAFSTRFSRMRRMRSASVTTVGAPSSTRFRPTCLRPARPEKEVTTSSTISEGSTSSQRGGPSLTGAQDFLDEAAHLALADDLDVVAAHGVLEVEAARQGLVREQHVPPVVHRQHPVLHRGEDGLDAGPLPGDLGQALLELV